jgi:hypothetical protein
MNTNETPIEQAAEQQPEAPKKERRRTLTERLYQQIDIMEREQGKIATGYEGSSNPRAARNENLAFAKQITDTANAIINIKRGGK